MARCLFSLKDVAHFNWVKIKSLEVFIHHLGEVWSFGGREGQCDNCNQKSKRNLGQNKYMITIFFKSNFYTRIPPRKQSFTVSFHLSDVSEIQIQTQILSILLFCFFLIKIVFVVRFYINISFWVKQVWENDFNHNNKHEIFEIQWA